MNSLNLPAVVIWILVVIQSNIPSIQSELVEVYKNDPTNWRETGKNPNLAKFNSLYTISIDEENLNTDKICTGKCNLLYGHGPVSARSSSGLDQCPGNLIDCWFKSETEKRKKAHQDFKDASHVFCGRFRCSRMKSINYDEIKNTFDHTGNICKCQCHRSYNPNPANSVHGELLDSVCFDPVSVDEGFVATGVRFNRRGNVIYLQLKQARLVNGRLIETSKKWTDFKRCSSANTKPVFYDFKGKNYKSLEFKLEDITLSEDAAVTGVTLGDSVRGRYINENGNFDRNRGEFTKKSQCRGSSTESVLKDQNIQPSTSCQDNNVFSKTCKKHMSFKGASQDFDNLPFIVPYVDLQEVVTDPPEIIHGIGWHHRGFSGCGGFLALKILKKKL